MISPKVPNWSSDSWSKSVSNIDSNSPRNSTSKIFPRFGPLRPILLCTMGHYGEFSSALWPLRQIWLCAMSHCIEWGHTVKRCIGFCATMGKGGQTAIWVRWSTAQRTNEMLADQRTGKNSGPAPADYRNWFSASPLLNYLREVILSLKGPLTWEGMVETSCKFRHLSFKKTPFEWYHFLPNQSRWTVPLILTIYSRKCTLLKK